MIILGWETSMRRDEILALVPSWIDYKRRCINLSKEVWKNGKLERFHDLTMPLNCYSVWMGVQ